MTHTLEYRDMNKTNSSTLTVIERGESRLVAGREIRLEHATAGYECAGSCAIWVDGYWAVRFNDKDGTRHGRRCRQESDARELFKAWTK